MVEDIDALRQDEALLDGVGSGLIQDGEEELIRLLVGWRSEILAEAIPELVTVEEAQVVLAAARGSDWWVKTTRVIETALYVLVVLLILTLVVGI